MRDLFLEPFTITRLIGKNVVEVTLSNKFSRKHPVFPVILIKPLHQNGEYKFPSRNKTHIPQDIVEVKKSPFQVNKAIKVMKVRLNGKNNRQDLVRFKN
ncbi:hypothetical protein O181_022636 [Austropuccinia psidii MF-1]|uniref:Uncharacterized protein n=1 Tax=Austropuccinia psidii MF-1 TaxID=1389203 RepID=A0A9Q3GWW0_9BASI|nr:hypothetical protein [Austropuccinia psidii MF-1]